MFMGMGPGPESELREASCVNELPVVAQALHLFVYCPDVSSVLSVKMVNNDACPQLAPSHRETIVLACPKNWFVTCTIDDHCVVG